MVGFIKQFWNKALKSNRELPKKSIRGRFSFMGSDLVDALIRDGQELEIIKVKKNGRIELTDAFDILK